MTTTTTVATLFSISLGPDYSLQASFNPWLIASLLAGAALAFCIRRYWIAHRLATFEIDRADLGIGSGTISFRPNLRDQEIAYKIWVELSTRKIGLSIDLKHDVIVEVYDSWHTFFTLTRELIKDIPISKVKNGSTRQIITLSINVLNEGLRPHLTEWQARFRHWYDKQIEKRSDDVDPQAIQAEYPRFKELEIDLMRVNHRLMRYREKMRELVLGLLPDETMPLDESPKL